MPATYINRNMQLGTRLDHITAVVTGAKKGAQIKAKTVQHGEHRGEILLYAKTGIRESLKNFFFSNILLPFSYEDTRRVAAREVLRSLARQLNGIPGMEYYANEIYTRADPISVLGKCHNLPKGDGRDFTMATAKGRSMAENYAHHLRQAQAMYRNRFERIFFPVPAKEANLFVFQRPASLSRLYAALEAAGCPADEVVELTNAMRSFVKQSNDAYLQQRRPQRTPVSLSENDQLFRADYSKVERFAHFWLKRAELKKNQQLPWNDGLEKANWLPAFDFFMHKNFARSIHGPIRVGEDPVVTPEKMLNTHQDDTPQNLTYLRMICEFMRRLVGNTIPHPYTAVKHCAEHLVEGLKLQPRSVQLEFIASNGKEFKAQLLLYALSNRLLDYRDALGFFNETWVADYFATATAGMGFYYRKHLSPLKTGELQMLNFAGRFIDAIYARAAARISYEFENRNLLVIDGTRFRRNAQRHQAQGGYHVQEFTAVVKNKKGRYVDVSDSPKDRLIVMKPMPFPDDKDEDTQMDVCTRRLQSAVATVHWGKSLGALMQVEEAKEMEQFDCRPGRFARDSKTGTVRIGPYIYMIRDGLLEVGQATLFQRLDVYQRRQAMMGKTEPQV